MFDGDPESMFDEIFNELDKEQGGLDSKYRIIYIIFLHRNNYWNFRFHGWISQKSIIKRHIV